MAICGNWAESSSVSTSSAVPHVPSAVVKLQVKSLPSGFPDRSVIAEARVALYAVSTPRVASGVNVAVLVEPLKLTAPLTLLLPSRVKLLPSTVTAKMSSLKVAVTALEVATPVAPSTGLVLLTVGAVASLGGGVTGVDVLLLLQPSNAAVKGNSSR